MSSDQDLAEKQRILAERQAQLEALRQQRAQMGQQQQGGGGGNPYHHQQQHQHQGHHQQQQQSWGYAPHRHHHHHHQHQHHQQQPQHGGYNPQQQWGQPGQSQWGTAPQQQQRYQQHGQQQQHQKPVYTEEYVDDDEYDDDEEYDEFADMEFAPEDSPTGGGPDKDFEDMMAEAEAAATNRNNTGSGAELDSDEVFAMAKAPTATTARTLADYAAAGKLKSLRDNNGRTVLHYVAETRNAALAKQLIAGADANVKDDNGMTAGDVAAICGDAAMCEVFGSDASKRGALLKAHRVQPPKFAVVKGAPKQQPKCPGAFWGTSGPTQPDGSLTFSASELGDTTKSIPDVDSPAFVVPATPLDWTRPTGGFTPEYHARVHSLVVAGNGATLATADVAPVGNLVVNGEALPNAAYAVGGVRTQRGALRHLMNFTAGYLQGCIGGFVSPRDLSPVLAPVCAIKWYQRSVSALAALDGPSSSLLFPDVQRYYSVTRTDVLRKHDVAPDDAAAAASAWRVCEDAAADAPLVAKLLRAKSGDYTLTFDPTDEATQHVAFGCNVVTLARADGSACATFERRDHRGHESLLLAFSTLTTSAEIDGVCAAVRGLLPDVATVYASTLGLTDATLAAANFALIDGSHQFFYAVSGPGQPVCPATPASKVRFPMLF